MSDPLDKEVIKDISLIIRFNDRDRHAFSQVYFQLFDGLYYFTNRLFAEQIDAQDMIHDILLAVWVGKMQFESMAHLKNYIYQSIRNQHKNFLKHRSRTEKAIDQIRNLDEFQFTVMVETEVFSILNVGERVLPTECVRLLHLYLQGYEIKEIAEKLNKSQYTIYNQRNTMIEMLRKHLPKDKIMIIFPFI